MFEWNVVHTFQVLLIYFNKRMSIFSSFVPVWSASDEEDEEFNFSGSDDGSSGEEFAPTKKVKPPNKAPAKKEPSGATAKPQSKEAAGTKAPAPAAAKATVASKALPAPSKALDRCYFTW